MSDEAVRIEPVWCVPDHFKAQGVQPGRAQQAIAVICSWSIYNSGDVQRGSVYHAESIPQYPWPL